MANITNQRSLAKALGVSHGTVGKYVHRQDWPVRRSAPWTTKDVAAIKRWRTTLSEDPSGKAEQATPNSESMEQSLNRARADALLKFHRARRAKVDADLAEGNAIPRDTLDKALSRFAASFVSVLDELEQSVPPLLEGDVRQNHAILREALHDARRRLAEQRELVLE